ncbi:P-loop containing nucleoside triphosphate hydrolase protein, partial [Paraphysoderma sedebokerense]
MNLTTLLYSVFLCEDRPLSNREILRNTSICVNLDKETQTKLTILKPNNSLPSSSSPPIISTTDENSNNSSKRTFVYDRCFDSIDENNENFAGQETVFETIGKPLLEHAFDGYNVCLFAYGQTGSGKSYTMMGFNGAQGVIPRACNYLFERLYKEQENDPDLSINIEVSYLEIYCEKVRDLLNPNNKANLRVREHPIMGPYVEDLARLIVSDYSEISNLIDEGNKSRTVAATNMNEISSRSHAVFQLILTQKRYDKETNLTTEKVSRISFVDLAGSERANSTGATGLRLKEGGQINKSLTSLGKVICALAERASPRKSVKKGSAEVFVPYRDSVLTWLLKDSLGGNSKTAMISCISPSDLHYEETLSTLRYSDRAKKIMNVAVVNEDPNAKLIRELKEEIAILKQQLALREENGDVDDDQDQEEEDMSHAELLALQDRLGESEKLMSQLNETWEDKLRKTQEIALEREKALEELGITLSKNSTGAVGVYTPKWPHLVNLNEDPLMSECLIYQLRPGRVTIGKTPHSDDLHNGKDLPQIVLSGENILDEHCFVVNEDGIVSITPLHGSLTFVNGHKIDAFTVLKSGDRIRLGDNHRFRFNNPEEVRKERARSS